jgi:quinohemoprotein ethanol dehydrogenase
VPGVDKGENIPNLGYVPADTLSQLDRFVFCEALAAKGMPDFTGKLTREDVEKIKAFIQGTAEAVRPKPVPVK